MTLEILTSTLCEPDQLVNLASFSAQAENPTADIASISRRQDELPRGSNQAIFYRLPAYYVSEQMERGVSPLESLKAWCQDAELILDIYRKNRRRTSLIGQESALYYPERCRDLLSERVGQASVSDELQSSVSPQTNVTNVSFFLLATIACDQDSRSQTLLSEIEACSLPVGVPEEFDANALYRRICQQLEIKQEQIEEVQSENQFLSEKLSIQEKEQAIQFDAANQQINSLTSMVHELQEEAERLLLEHRQAEQEREEAKAQLSAQIVQKEVELDKERNANAEAQSEWNRSIDEYETQLSELSARLQATEAENENLVEQLHKVQEELEYRISISEGLISEKSESEARITELTGQARSLAQKLELKREQLSAIRSSTFWKVAAPARLLGKPFRRNSKDNKAISRQIELVKDSKFFDAKWYSETYPDVSQSNMSPEEHFVRYGGFESRLPSPVFNTPAYLARYPDVSESGMNPLVHYLKFGVEEQREIN